MMLGRSHHEPSRLSYLLQGYADVDQMSDCNIQALSLDSRTVKQGDLFFACAGTQGHGLDYIDQVCNSGAAAIAWEPTEKYNVSPGINKNIPIIEIENLTDRLGYIADRFYGHPSKDLCVIGITGTDGKTSCSHFLASALDKQNIKAGVIGTIGYGVFGQLQEASHTTPDAIRVHELLHDMREQGVHYVVMEVSSHGLDQGRVNGVVFEVAVLTNVSRDHLDYHGDQVSYAEAKEKLFRMPGLSCVVLNNDDEFGVKWLDSLSDSQSVITYGLNGDTSKALQQSVVISNVKLMQGGLEWHVDSAWGDADFANQLYGRFNVYNLAAVLSVLGYLGLPWDKICDYMQQMQTVPGRMEICHVQAGHDVPQVIVDFAHTPDALEQVLSSLGEHGFGRIWCVFGCGGDRDKGKRPLMGRVAEKLSDQVILTDDNPRTESGEQIINEILFGMQNPDVVHIESDRKKAIHFALTSANQNDVVLIAGKGHESYQLIQDKKIPFNDREVVMTWLRKEVH